TPGRLRSHPWWPRPGERSPTASRCSPTRRTCSCAPCWAFPPRRSPGCSPPRGRSSPARPGTDVPEPRPGLARMVKRAQSELCRTGSGGARHAHERVTMERTRGVQDEIGTAPLGVAAAAVDGEEHTESGGPCGLDSETATLLLRRCTALAARARVDLR